MNSRSMMKTGKSTAWSGIISPMEKQVLTTRFVFSRILAIAYDTMQAKIPETTMTISVTKTLLNK